MYKNRKRVPIATNTNSGPCFVVGYDTMITHLPFISHFSDSSPIKCDYIP